MLNNPGFYPTPEAVSAKILSRIDSKALHTASILEPSAGKGDLADAILKARYQGFSSDYESYRENVHCCEIDPELQACLRGKGYTLIGGDFLSFWPDEKYDLIVMNPPFADGEKHLLHAWEILEHGDILCLLNGQTVDNPFSATRQRLQAIIEEHGEVEHLGACFLDAERRSEAEVCLVCLHKEAPAIKFDFLRVGTDADHRPEFEDAHSFDGEIATRNTVGNLVAQYDKCRQIFVDIATKVQELSHYARGLVHEHGDGSITSALSLAVENLMRGGMTRFAQERAYNTFVRGLKKSAWDEVFRLANAGNLMSQGIRNQFALIQSQHERMAFSESNILELLDTLFANRGNILRECVLEAFDNLTRYHKKNRLYVEGWKSNDAWKVNERFILPCLDTRWSLWSIEYRCRRELEDLDRAMAFLEGKTLDMVPRPITATLEEMFRCHGAGVSGMLAISTYFEIRPYRKSTCHFKFRDRSLWECFNLVAAEGKNWLPDDYKAREKAARSREKHAEQCRLPLAG